MTKFQEVWNQSKMLLPEKTKSKQTDIDEKANGKTIRKFFEWKSSFAVFLKLPTPLQDIPARIIINSNYHPCDIHHDSAANVQNKTVTTKMQSHEI